jgi:Uma2 family endonuclease
MEMRPMVLHTPIMTAAAFDEFALLPENADKILEFIAGEIIEVPSNAHASKIAALIAYFINAFVFPRKLGHVTGEAGGYQIMGERYAPDVAFVSNVRQAELDKSGYNHLPPDLVVEVDFPTAAESSRTLRVKTSNYLAAGCVVWLVFPETKEVEVHMPNGPVQVLGIDDTLDGGAVLPGFSLTIKDIFAE